MQLFPKLIFFLKGPFWRPFVCMNFNLLHQNKLRNSIFTNIFICFNFHKLVQNSRRQNQLRPTSRSTQFSWTALISFSPPLQDWERAVVLHTGDVKASVAKWYTTWHLKTVLETLRDLEAGHSSEREKWNLIQPNHATSKQMSAME